jgi:zinc transporter 1/2/3
MRSLQTLLYPLISIPVVFILALFGSRFPIWFQRFNANNNPFFRFFSGYAAGIVLGVGFIHSLPDAFNSWNDFVESLQKDESELALYLFPWPAVLTMVGALATLIVEQVIEGITGHKHSHAVEDYGSLHVREDKLLDGKTEEGKQPEKDIKENEPLVNVSQLYVLLFGLSFHSVFVGLALGISESASLFAAVVFHQFFEGVAFGSRVLKTKLDGRLHIWLLDLLFAISAPFGTGIGIVIAEVIQNSGVYFIVNSVFQALSGGILVYVSLVHMMKEETEHVKGKLLVILFLGFVLGAISMSIIGIWA